MDEHTRIYLMSYFSPHASIFFNFSSLPSSPSNSLSPIARFLSLSSPPFPSAFESLFFAPRWYFGFFSSQISLSPQVLFLFYFMNLRRRGKAKSVANEIFASFWLFGDVIFRPAPLGC